MSIFVIDIDGVLAKEGTDWRHYDKCPVIKGAEAALGFLHNFGHKIILHTARHSEDREVTEEWLKKNRLIYDELVMGKPYGHVYIDDKALLFTSWEETCWKIGHLMK